MDDAESSTFANREEPIPVLRVPFPDAHDAASENVSDTRKARDALKQHADKLRDKFDSVKDDLRSGGLQERLLTTLMAQMLPTDQVADDGTPIVDRRSRAYVERPAFSIPTMSNNFRRFNARCGVLFVFENRLIRLFSWRTPSHTLSFLAAYTLICLQPALIPSVPFALILFYIMIPSFLARHPPPPSPSEMVLENSANPEAAAEIETAWSSYAYTTHATAPPSRVRPAPEMSKDFFRNMRDLQNSMEDFSLMHDAAIAHVTPYTDFSNETLSTAVFIIILVGLLIATVAAHLVPWRLVALVAGWGITAAGHAKVQEKLAEIQGSATTQQTLLAAQSWFYDFINADIVLDEPAEVREVEVFELQHRRKQPVNSGKSTDYDGDDENWEPWLFTPSPHDPLCPQRLSGAWPAGTQFFEEVCPPSGWLWRDKKWTLDLLSEAWVEERCVTGVEVERQGGRWVYDIAYPKVDHSAHKGGAKKAEKQSTVKSWEEGTGKGQKGEWRRRRWVRLVERKAQKASTATQPIPKGLATLDAGMTNPGPVDAASVAA